LSDIEFEQEELGWGGITRPGANKEEFEAEHGHVDDWQEMDSDMTDSDDDDHGGHMMPIPRLF